VAHYVFDVKTHVRAVLWTVALFLLAVTIFGIARYLRHRDFYDFVVYRIAGERALNATPLYRPNDGHYQFKYFPAFAVAAIPLAKIDLDTAIAGWFFLSFGLLVAFVRRSVRALPGRRHGELTLAWLTALFLGRFYVRELILGQDNVLFGLALVLALTAVQARRFALAGALVALTAFIKPNGVLFLPWIAAAGGVAAATSSVATLTAGFALPAIFYGWHGNLTLWSTWYTTVTSTTSENLMSLQSISLATMWARWIGPGPAAAVLAVVTGFVLLASVVWVWAVRARVTDPDYLEAALLMLLVPLLSPQSWDYVLLIGTPAVTCLVDRVPEVSRRWRFVIVTALVFTGFTFYDLVRHAINYGIVRASLLSVAAIVLAVGLVHLRARALA
jgi:hypothetical protein